MNDRQLFNARTTRPRRDRYAASERPYSDRRTSTGSSGTRGGPLLRGRGPGRDTGRQLRLHPDAPDRERLHLRRAGEVSVDWMRMSPYPASSTFLSRVFDAGQAADWGALSWHANAPPDTSVQISVRTGDTPTPDGTLERLHPDQLPAAVTSPATPATCSTRLELGSSDPNQTPSLERRLHRLLDGGGHDGANDHAEDAGAERHQRPTQHQRGRPVQRADEPGDDQQLDRSAAKAGGGQRRAGERELRGEHGDDRSERRPGSERGLQRHGGGHGHGRQRQPARRGRHLELHHREPQLHRHHRRPTSAPAARAPTPMSPRRTTARSP